MPSVFSNLAVLDTQDVVTTQQIWVTHWSESDGVTHWASFGTQAEAVKHLRAQILPTNCRSYVGTYWASATVHGGINHGEIDLRLII